MNGNIDLNLFKTFYIVANCNSFTKASEQLFISQPAVTQAVKKLEEQLNTELFIRTSSGICLTENGKMVYHYAEHLCNLAEAGLNLIKEQKEEKSKIINVGVPTHIGTFYFVKYLKEFNKNYKDVKVNIINKKSDEMLNLLLKRELDIVLDTDMISINDNTIKTIKLVDLKSCFVCNEKFKKLADKNTIEPKELTKYPLILPSSTTFNRKLIDANFEKYNIILSPLIEANSSSISKGIIKNGVGIGWMIKEFVEDDLASKKLFEVKVNIPSVYTSLSVAYHKKFAKKYVEEFIKILKTNL